MLLTGASIIKRQLVRNTRSVTEQLQPCGVDLTLQRALTWTSAATVDFDNAHRRAADTRALPFTGGAQTVTLAQGAYLVEFNETVHVPLDCMGQVFVRSSLWRSGVALTAGLVDAGYEGALGALLDVKSPAGITLHRNAKLAQITFHRMEGQVEGYSGVYQLSKSSIGRTGPNRSSQGDEM